MIKNGRHDRGWPKVEVITFIVETDASWRFCIEPMGHRDAIWERSGYVEIIQWKPRRTENKESTQ
jgi:hypothetical protein